MICWLQFFVIKRLIYRIANESNQIICLLISLSPNLLYHIWTNPYHIWMNKERAEDEYPWLTMTHGGYYGDSHGNHVIIFRTWIPINVRPVSTCNAYTCRIPVERLQSASEQEIVGRRLDSDSELCQKRQVWQAYSNLRYFTIASDTSRHLAITYDTLR